VERLSTAERTLRFTHEYAAPRFSMSDFENQYNYGSGDEGRTNKSNKKAEKKYSGARRPDGMSTEQLKADCRNKGLVVGGMRFDLVLRLLQNETADQTGIEPKKAAGTFDDATGAFKPKPRAKSMKLPDPAKLGERMQEKEMEKWSNDKYKYHASTCISLCNELLQKEVMDKELFRRGEEELVWQVVLELVRYWIYQGGVIGQRGWGDVVTGMGRASYELGCLYEMLIQFLAQTKDMGKLVEMGIDRLLRDLRKHASAYGQDGAEFEAALNKYFPVDKEQGE
jgi:hypothetical protein